MLVIIDGGSTKADWYIQHPNGSTSNLTTTGFNPNYDSEERISSLLEKEAKSHFEKGSVFTIHYYGTGCWDVSRKQVVKRAMLANFPKAAINIDHDLLAAARATCGDEPGIACILGTGSNSLLFDGKEEKDNVTNLGFLMGDEGSGAVIGKELVKSYFYREMPKELHYVLEKECPNGKMDILDQIYKGGVPAAYLATFTKKYSAHIGHPFIWNLIKNCFEEFLTRHVFKYEGFRSLPIHFVGSVAFHFKRILEELLQEHQLKMGVVLQRPIEALFNYHLQKDKPVKV